MPADSKLVAKLKTTPPGTSSHWEQFEAAVEVLADYIVAIGTLVPVTVTPHFKTLGASGSQMIPSGAKGWAATILTGTGTIGGEVVIAGQSVADANTLAASVTVATDSASSAFVRWNT